MAWNKSRSRDTVGSTGSSSSSSQWIGWMAIMLVITAGIALYQANQVTVDVKREEALGSLQFQAPRKKDATVKRLRHLKRHTRRKVWRPPYESKPSEHVAIGILSQKNVSFFQRFQQEIDDVPWQTRCRRYGFLNETTQEQEYPPYQRRIFYGSLIAQEPWELMEIVATETYGLFEGMVFVESNRTQTASPRTWVRQDDYQPKWIQQLFGTNQIQIRAFVQEDMKLLGLKREHLQRQDILYGWKEMGMTGEDIGYIGDLDETFTRDFFRALQTCPNVPTLDYELHHCHNQWARLPAAGQVYEGSPECIAQDRLLHHPDVVLGACIEGIGDNVTKNILAPRWDKLNHPYAFIRAPGYGKHMNVEKGAFTEIQGNKYPLWSAADFRRTPGGKQFQLQYHEETGKEFKTKQERQQLALMERHTAYHFHNFFANLTTTRKKYLTYAHPMEDAMTRPLEDMNHDMRMMVRCVKNQPMPKDELFNGKPVRWRYRAGGQASTKQFWPIYFQDEDYRQRKHERMKQQMEHDEVARLQRIKEQEKQT